MNMCSCCAVHRMEPLRHASAVHVRLSVLRRYSCSMFSAGSVESCCFHCLLRRLWELPLSSIGCVIPLYRPYRWEKLIHTHTKPYWIRLPSRLPIAILIWFVGERWL